MQRVTITIDNQLAADIDAHMVACGYANRSETMRDLARSGLAQAKVAAASGQDCIATLTYVFDHATRELPRRLTEDFHQHGLAQATLHVHLDHDSCLEVTVLKGNSADVKTFADHVISERGVRHGHVVFIPNEAPASHQHPHSHEAASSRARKR